MAAGRLRPALRLGLPSAPARRRPGPPAAAGRSVSGGVPLGCAAGASAGSSACQAAGR